MDEGIGRKMLNSVLRNRQKTPDKSEYKTEDWPFDAPKNLAVITVRQALEEGKPIMRVSHDAEDGGWQFHCAEESKTEDAQIVSLYHMIQKDPSILELADLPIGWAAWRTEAGAVWQRTPRAPEKQGESD